jgi:hypothetical protein
MAAFSVLYQLDIENTPHQQRLCHISTIGDICLFIYFTITVAAETS